MTLSADYYRVGVSRCLLGEPVRYDGGEQRDDYLADNLAAHWQLLPLCPELAIGMGVPREPIQIVQVVDEYRARAVAAPHRDVTAALRQLVDDQQEFLASLAGFVLMTRSPSCGLNTVKIHNDEGELLGRGASGIFAAHLRQQLPWLPLIEAIDLADPARRAVFFTQVAALADFKASVETGGVSAKKLIDFYSRYKYLVMAHSAKGYKTLGPLLAKIDAPQACGQAFKIALMAALGAAPSRRAHLNTLQHLQGYFRAEIAADEYRKLTDSIAQFARGEISLRQALAQLQQALAHCDLPYLAQQRYWQPYPDVWEAGVVSVRDSLD